MQIELVVSFVDQLISVNESENEQMIDSPDWRWSGGGGGGGDSGDGSILILQNLFLFTLQKLRHHSCSCFIEQFSAAKERAF